MCEEEVKNGNEREQLVGAGATGFLAHRGQKGIIIAEKCVSVFSCFSFLGN